MKLTLYLANGTKKAYGFSRRQRQTTEDTAANLVWLPKVSVKVLQIAESKAWTWPEAVIEISDKLAKKKGLK